MVYLLSQSTECGTSVAGTLRRWREHIRLLRLNLARAAKSAGRTATHIFNTNGELLSPCANVSKAGIPDLREAALLCDGEAGIHSHDGKTADRHEAKSAAQVARTGANKGFFCQVRCKTSVLVSIVFSLLEGYKAEILLK